MARRENEAVTVEPIRVVGIVLQGMAVEDRADFGGSQRQTEVAGFRFRHGVHCQSARVASGQFEWRNIKTHISEVASERSVSNLAWQD